MVIAADSWWAPTAAQLAAARAAGVGAWLGYFEVPGDHIFGGGWSDQDFQAALASGLRTGAFCSGWDDPAACAARARRLGIRIYLDDETSIRGDGPWADPWLAASGACLYGESPVMQAHLDHGHPGYVVADYTADPGSTWVGGLALPAPLRPTGRQYAGDQAAGLAYVPAGRAVDLSRLDPQLLSQPLQGDRAMLVRRSTDGEIALALGDVFLHLSGPQWTNVQAGYGGSPPLVDDDSLFAALEAAAAPSPASAPTTLAVTGGSLTLG